MKQGDYMGTKTGYQARINSLGSLVVIFNGKILWSSNSGLTTKGLRLTLEPNGELAMYNDWNRQVWGSMTGGKSDSKRYRLTMQDDGNLALYDEESKSKAPIWSTGTTGRT